MCIFVFNIWMSNSLLFCFVWNTCGGGDSDSGSEEDETDAEADLCNSIVTNKFDCWGIWCLRKGFLHLTEEVSVEELMLEYVESVRRRPEEQRLTFFWVEWDFQVFKILQTCRVDYNIFDIFKVPRKCFLKKSLDLRGHLHAQKLQRTPTPETKICFQRFLTSLSSQSLKKLKWQTEEAELGSRWPLDL